MQKSGPCELTMIPGVSRTAVKVAMVLHGVIVVEA